MGLLGLFHATARPGVHLRRLRTHHGSDRRTARRDRYDECVDGASDGLARLKDPATPYEGPIQFDAAVNEEVAAAKITEPAALRVAGTANVCVFPDLNAGNTAYKAVQRATGCTVIGPVVQGLSKPVNDLSRGSSVQDIVMTAVITAIQAQQRDGTP